MKLITALKKIVSVRERALSVGLVFCVLLVGQMSDMLFFLLVLMSILMSLVVLIFMTVVMSSEINIFRSLLPVEGSRKLRADLVLVGCITGELVLFGFVSQWVLLYKTCKLAVYYIF